MAEGDFLGSLLKGVGRGARSFAASSRAENVQKGRTAEAQRKEGEAANRAEAATQQKLAAAWTDFGFKLKALRNQGTEEGSHAADQFENLIEDVDPTTTAPPDFKSIEPILSQGFEQEGTDFEALAREFEEGLGEATGIDPQQQDLAAFASEAGFAPGSLETAGGRRDVGEGVLPFAEFALESTGGRLGPLQRGGALGPLGTKIAIEGVGEERRQRADAAAIAGERRKVLAKETVTPTDTTAKPLTTTQKNRRDKGIRKTLFSKANKLYRKVVSVSKRKKLFEEENVNLPASINSIDDLEKVIRSGAAGDAGQFREILDQINDVGSEAFEQRGGKVASRTPLGTGSGAQRPRTDAELLSLDANQEDSLTELERDRLEAILRKRQN